jgi:hypothetical protein
MLRRILVCVAIAVVPAALPTETLGSQNPTPLSLFVDVDYYASPLTGNPPVHQNFLGLCNGDPGTGPDTRGSQNLHPSDSGTFNEIWSVTTPTVRVIGSVTATQFSASLNCTNGPGSGSINASGDLYSYVGTWTFTKSGQSYAGHTDVTRRCFAANAGGPYEIENNSGISDPLQLNGGQSDACGDEVLGHYAWRINGQDCIPCGNNPAPYLAGLDLPLVLTVPTVNLGNGLPIPVSLTFTDPQGRQTISTTTVTVLDNRPFARYAVAPAIVRCGEPVTFDAQTSYHGSPKLRHIVSYAWGFTDESQLMYARTLTRTFSRPGVKFFFLLVVDNQNKADLVGTVRVNEQPFYAYVRVRSSAPPFTDEVLTPGAVGKATHVTELRARINEVRSKFGLGPYAYADPNITAGTTIKAQHLVEMRSALAQAFALSTATPVPYTDPNLAAGSLIKVAHVDELRTAVLVLECLET